MPGQLFTHHFLTHGITETPEWRSSDAAAVNFQGGLIEIFESFQGYRQPNEAVTEQELIRPVLELLGWADYLPQQGAARNEDIPDLLLFPDAASKERAAARSSPQERYRDAIVVEESKRFGLPLDARDADGRRSRTPHGQMLRYLSTPTYRVRGPGPVGDSDQRRRVAPLRLPRPPPRHRLLRGRPGADAGFGRRRQPAARLPPVPPELLHAAAGGRRQLPGSGAGRG